MALGAGGRVPGRWLWLVLLVLGMLGFVLRFRLLVAGGGLVGSDGYDDGVYYAAADALVHGRLPYRDFLLLHPPGVVLALAPFAFIGSVFSDPVGVGIARIAFITVGAGNTVLVGAVARRFGWTAAIVASAVYAVFPSAVYAERSTLLEPLGTAAVLCGALLVRRSWTRPGWGTFAGGVALGAGAGVKIWYVVPAVVLLAFQPRRRLAMLGGIAAGASAVCLPFFAAAPGDMLREVVLDQLGRPRSGDPSLTPRVVSILGTHDVFLPGALALPSRAELAVLVSAIAVIAALAACTVRGGRVWPAMTLACGITLLASPSYFPHYSAFVAPALAITLGIGLRRIGTLLPRGLRLAPPVGALAVFGFVAAFSAHSAAPGTSPAVPLALLQNAADRVHGCVISDDPALLAGMNVLSRDLAAGCRVWPDVTGWTYDSDRLQHGHHDVSRRANQRWQTDVTDFLTSGSAVIVHRPDTGLSARSLRLVSRGRIIATTGTYTLRATP